MAGSVNKVILVGNIGNAPDIRSTQDGRRIASLSVATSESWKDKHSGERRERTEWHRVVIYNEALVGIVEKYARKGSKVYLEGSLQTRKWQDKDGIDRYTTEVTLQAYGGNLTLLSRVEGDDAGGSDEYSRPAPARQNPEAAPKRARVVEADPFISDEIPF